MELISVIVPVYKVERYIDECIESIRNQTYSDLEIVLVDDGSPDSCPSICDNYARKDDRIKVIHKKNGGLSSARNIGIKESLGQYITFVDSDDVLDFSMIETLYCFLKKENTDTVTKLENEKNFEEKTTVDHKDENPEISEKRTVEIKNDLGAASELLKDEDKKADKIPLSESEEKKDRRPVSIELKGRSDAFKKIIDIALAYEKLENDQKKLKEIIRLQNGENSELKEEIDNLKRNLEETEVICQQRQNAIEKLQADIKHRNEVIDIVKADKDESSQEFKNALAASLRIYRQDFTELKELDMSNDVGFAVIDILESVFKTLGKNGIGI